MRADALDFLGDATNHGLALAVVGLALHWRAKAALLKGRVMGIKASKEDLQILHADPGGERGDRVGPSYPAFVADSPLEGALTSELVSKRLAAAFFYRLYKKRSQPSWHG